MATKNMDNYKASFVDKPSEKYPKGEVAGRLRLLRDQFTLEGDENSGDELLAGFIPANSIIVDGWMAVDKSLGATGIFTLGHLATEDQDGGAIAKDADAIVGSVDGGGQAAFTRADNGAILGKRLGAETQVYAACTEDLDGAVTDAILDFCVFYVND